jgi:hypothetical protein
MVHLRVARGGAGCQMAAGAWQSLNFGPALIDLDYPWKKMPWLKADEIVFLCFSQMSWSLITTTTTVHDMSLSLEGVCNRTQWT